MEYKLHLLLRPRRSIRSTSTADRVAGSTRQGILGDSTPRLSPRLPLAPSPQTPPALASSSQSRQHRLQQLTTQLLWRLQQSSPYHASASKNATLQSPPREAGDGVRAISTSQRASYGLEESRGALYEIGVADDGTFVGLLQDELDESLGNLRIMAATLGCSVEVLRQVAVGEGEWIDDVDQLNPDGRISRDTLWVAEAFVRPNLGGLSQGHQGQGSGPHQPAQQDRVGSDTIRPANTQCSTTDQLRVTLTGPTTSGKSSLLGILTSGALDNGRGKSRLGLLKHRHEIESGMTSSVTQELMGYAASVPSDDLSPVRIVNYALGDVASWPDVHALCEGGRLVFFSDSAGHPRYRRTTMRGLVGWAPHWTLLCIPADSVDGTTGLGGSTPPLKDQSGGATAEFDLTDSHLQICLDLQTPLIIAITKLDLASRTGLKQLLAKLLTTLKAAGRRPILLRDSSREELDEETPTIAADILAELRAAIPGNIAGGNVVPIICTSAVNGTGISKLHALLHDVPIPRESQDVAAPLTAVDMGPSTGVFHVEDVFGDKVGIRGETETVVVSGILRRGDIAVGDVVNLGPYSMGHTSEDPDYSPSLKPSSFTGGPRSFPGALSGRSPPWPASAPLSDHPEWRKVKVVSLRNLRLSVRCLLPDQVGTIGLQPVDPQLPLRSSIARIRKGMVVSRQELAACSVIEAEFPGTSVRELSIGSLVVVYLASVRATARVVLMSVGDEPEDLRRSTADVPFHFDLDDSDEMTASQVLRASTIVHLRFIASREYITPGDTILIMPGGGPGLVGSAARGEKGLAGLEGFVGKVLRGTDAHERLERRVET